MRSNRRRSDASHQPRRLEGSHELVIGGAWPGGTRRAAPRPNNTRDRDISSPPRRSGQMPSRRWPAPRVVTWTRVDGRLEGAPRAAGPRPRKASRGECQARACWRPLVRLGLRAFATAIRHETESTERVASKMRQTDQDHRMRPVVIRHVVGVRRVLQQPFSLINSTSDDERVSFGRGMGCQTGHEAAARFFIDALRRRPA